MPALSGNIQLDDDAPRCPRCGRRVSVDASICSACGYELVVHRARIRCSHCNRRIPADSATCPHCGADPRASRIPLAARIGMIVAVALLLVCCGWVAVRAVATNTLSRALGFIDQPTSTPTRVVQIIYVVATPVPPTLTPNPTATPTSLVSPTPTRRGARAATTAPTRPASQGSYSAPQLIAPLNATVYQGADSVVTLQWQPVSPNGLRENEWYFITINYTAHDGTLGYRYGWSKETRWNVPAAAWNDAAADARTYKWYVTVMQIQGVDPLLSPSKTAVSPNSATHTFIWH